MDIVEILCSELDLRKEQVANTIALIDDGNTIPFIARYRKEVTGSLDDEILRKFNTRLTYLRSLMERKEEIIRLIDEQGKLTDELKEKIDSVSVLAELEDIMESLSDEYLSELKDNVIPNGFYDKKIVKKVRKSLKR